MIKEYLIEKAEGNDPCHRCVYGDFKNFICLLDGELVGDGYRCAHFKPRNEEPENIAKSCGIPYGQQEPATPRDRGLWNERKSSQTDFSSDARRAIRR